MLASSQGVWRPEKKCWTTRRFEAKNSDEDVAAEDEVHALHEEHFAVVVEIEAGEGDAAADFIVDAELVVFGLL